MVVNIGWPRSAIYGEAWQHRFAPLMLTTILVATAVVAAAFAYRRRVALIAGAPSSAEAGL